MKSSKEQLLSNLKHEINGVQEKISHSITELKEIEKQGIEKAGELKLEEQLMLLEMKARATVRLEELAQLKGSPFFVRCDLLYENDKAEKNGSENSSHLSPSSRSSSSPFFSQHSAQPIKTIYFAKHQFSESNIFSWVAPISSIRFETPGKITYTLPDGTIEKATLVHKEQYMIVDGKVLFFATEAVGEPRDLIYQEHFSTRKNGFVLPEIVAVMEKAQDQVIRAHHVGPFVISGPAGSGKTTLALHRVGYLVQAPDTAPHYPSKSIIVFVQDTGTKEYFSHLLPELGIKDVRITTFSEWTMEVLGIDGVSFVIRPGKTEEEKDLVEFEKIKALREIGTNTHKYTTNHFSLLEKVYKPYLSKKHLSVFKEQIKKQMLDRIDLTILLKIFFKTHDKLEVVEEYFVPQKAKNSAWGNPRRKTAHDGLIKKTRHIPIEYSLIVVDEFQNYMPEQLSVFKKTLNPQSRSIIYVGDMAQQVQLGTVREWSHIGEEIAAERKVILQKVYRNTKQILNYIGALGYSVTVPEGLKIGPDVIEKVFKESHEEVAYIKELVEKKSVESGEQKVTFGILTKNEEMRLDLSRIFSSQANVHISTIAEAQGVEFDIVILAGIHPELFKASYELPEDLRADKKRIEKDLLYVGLTRGISELHVLGNVLLSDLVKQVGIVKL